MAYLGHGALEIDSQVGIAFTDNALAHDRKPNTIVGVSINKLPDLGLNLQNSSSANSTNSTDCGTGTNVVSADDFVEQNFRKRVGHVI